MTVSTPPLHSPLISPLGDAALLVRFGTSLTDAANRAAIAFATRLATRLPEGVLEIDPNLVSVLLRYDPVVIDAARLAGELRLLLSIEDTAHPAAGKRHDIAVRFDGDDIAEVAATLGMSSHAFIAAHNAGPLRVLTTGFAPGFVYCGFHDEALKLPRRSTVRPRVDAGTVLFAAGQTAITSTPIPTGWHVIGHTDFSNFDADAVPPTHLVEGDEIVFSQVPL